MNEFKYACPVCGQHMKCDVSQGGTVMECPTCFQKITAPQAPGDPTSKFILTGTKVSEKKPAPPVGNTLASVAPAKSLPITVAIVLAVVLVAGAGAMMFRDKLLKSGAPVVPTNQIMKAGAATNAAKAIKPPVVAPAANDAYWMLVLGTNALADTPVAGRIQGQDFMAERCTLQNGTLTLRAGTRGAVEFGFFVNFSGAQPAALAGKTINVTTNAEKAARISVRWKDAAGAVQKKNYDAGYALRLEFGALVKDRLPGKIYLCLPDAEQSYLLGSFNADARKPKPKPPKK